MPYLTYPIEVVGAMMENGVNGLHDVTTTPFFALGARYRKREGAGDCVYRYAKSFGACYAGRGAAFWASDAVHGLKYKLLSGTQDIGDTTVTIAASAGAHPAVEEDELFGGMILISDSEAATPTDADPQNRTIIGNDVSAEDAALTITLDTPLSRATTAATYAFGFPNPYNFLACGQVQSSEEASWATHAGVPAAYVSVADRYFWVQTWGPCWIAMQSDLSTKSKKEEEAVWRWDGSICLRSNAAPDAHTYGQLAGFVIDRGASACFIQLQIAP